MHDLGSNQIFGNYLRRSPSHREPAPARFSFTLDYVQNMCNTLSPVTVCTRCVAAGKLFQPRYLDQQWIVEDGDGLLLPGPVSPLLPEPTEEAGRSDGWTHRLFARH